MLRPGERAPAALVASVDEGLYVVSTRNVGGINPVSGDYSVGASGRRIVKGELAEPVSGVTLAAPMLELLANVREVGSDLRWIERLGRLRRQRHGPDRRRDDRRPVTRGYGWKPRCTLMKQRASVPVLKEIVQPWSFVALPLTSGSWRECLASAGCEYPVATVVGMVADGMSVEEILAAYPDLEREDVAEALRFAAEAVRERTLPLVITPT